MVDVAGAADVEVLSGVVTVVVLATVVVFSERGTRLMVLGKEETGFRRWRRLISGEMELESSSRTSEH